ncbi:MAG: carboxymuconolactone decarboxylase family protein [Gemmatimonadota bacterium]
MADAEGRRGGSRTRLSAELAALVELSAALARADPSGLRSALERASDVSRPARVEEALLQAYLFLGFPAVLSGFAEWRALGVRRTPPREEGRGRAQPALPPEGAPDPALWIRRGEALCRRIYGRAYAKLRQNVRRLHPALDDWMVMEGYGKVLGRPELDPVSRELCIVGLLAAADHPRQLHSHLRGALNVGADERAVGEALEIGLGWVADPGRRRAAEALWRRVRHGTSGPAAAEAPESGLGTTT